MGVTTALAIGIPFAALCAAWGALLWRVGRLEKDLAKLEGTAETLAAVDQKVETVRNGHGVRLGELRARLDKLEGFQAGYASVRRKTRANANDGIPQEAGEGER